jgi:hypothetical protein
MILWKGHHKLVLIQKEKGNIKLINSKKQATGIVALPNEVELTDEQLEAVVGGRGAHNEHEEHERDGRRGDHDDWGRRSWGRGRDDDWGRRDRRWR